MKTFGKPGDGWTFLQLIYALRQAEFTISLADFENICACRQRFPELDFKMVVKANVIHRSEENELFDLIWSLLRSDAAEPVLKEEKFDPAPGQPSLGGQGLGQGFGGISLLPSAVRSGPELETPYNGLLHLQNMPPEIAALGTEEQIQWVLGQMDLHQLLNAKERSYQRGEITEEELEQYRSLKKQWQEAIRQRLLWNRIQKENRWDSLKTEHWLYRPLASFRPEEKNTVRQALKLLGKRLAQRPGFRRKSANRGDIWMQRAIQELILGNGSIFRLEYQKRIPQRPELVVLCDISNSVLLYSEFLLFLVAHLQARFRKVRVFLFIDALWDISDEEELGTEGSLKIQAWRQRNSSGFSDYGNVFAEFRTDWLPVISSQATLLILGDARNNYRPAQAEYLLEIKEKVRRIYWLNPLDEKDWYASDNVLREYRPYCTDVFRCRTVKDLQCLARKVF